MDEEVCPDCGGFGQDPDLVYGTILRNACRTCNGTGYVDKSYFIYDPLPPREAPNEEISNEPVFITQHVYDQLYVIALYEYPNMAVGALYSDGDTITAINQLQNTTTEDPTSNFLIHPSEMLEAEKEATRQGLEMRGLFYSQRGRPSFSSKTRRWALPWYIHLVIGTSESSIELSAYVISDDRTKGIRHEVRIR